VTVVVISSEDVRAPSLAVSLSTYVPGELKLTAVLSEFAFPKLTVPGPLTLLQVVVSVAGGLGRPSSVALPAKEAEFGNVID
jgi:hypothetical protein